MPNSKRVFSILIILLGANVTIALLNTTILNIDHLVSNIMKEINNTLFYKLSYMITMLGSSTFLIPFTLVIMFVLVFLNRRLTEALVISLATLGTYLLNELIKMIVQRERPSLLAEVHANGYSYPSGHAMIPLVFYGLLLYYINKKIHHHSLSIVLSITLISLVFFIGLSRIILNVHYISDVLSGFLFGFILLQCFIIIDHKLESSHYKLPS